MVQISNQLFIHSKNQYVRMYINAFMKEGVKGSRDLLVYIFRYFSENITDCNGSVQKCTVCAYDVSKDA